MAKATILWFRRDLRLTDNAALLAAVERGAPIIPVFIWAPEEEGEWQPGAASRWWLHQSLRSLDESLRRFGSRLIIRRGPVDEALRNLPADAIYWNRLYESKTKEKLTPLGLELRSFPGYLLFEPWTIKPYRVFTPFWNACPAPEAPLPAPVRIPCPQDWPSSLPLADLKLEPAIDWASGVRAAWEPGEAGAARQIARFRVLEYAIERDRPDHSGTSRLSPYLHFGEISPRQAWRLGCTEYRRQLGWREFAHHLLFHFPHSTNEPMRPEFARFPWRMKGKLFEAWTEGRTGYPLVDAGMRELWHTGWMHNRVRMVVASFLVKHLLIPWQEGARWFWDTLVDADLANNTFGWQWAAGCGADAAPYFRIFNPTLQAEKFDPDGEYVRRWAPERIDPIIDHKAARVRALAAFATLKQSSARAILK